MKHPTHRDQEAKFSGTLRHYHRAGSQQHRTWDEWVDGKGAKSVNSMRWLKILGIIAAVVALGAIIVGLVIELS